LCESRIQVRQLVDDPARGGPELRELGIRPLIARRNTEHRSGLGTQRWVVERAFVLLHHLRRLRIRWEIRDDMHEALLRLGCAVICWRRLASLR
jgi:transposase